jgi:hypothetical protein
MRWDEAKAAFNSALEISPGDGPSALLVRMTIAANAPADWDGRGRWSTVGDAPVRRCR